MAGRACTYGLSLDPGSRTLRTDRTIFTGYPPACRRPNERAARSQSSRGGTVRAGEHQGKVSTSIVELPSGTDARRNDYVTTLRPPNTPVSTVLLGDGRRWPGWFRGADRRRIALHLHRATSSPARRIRRRGGRRGDHQLVSSGTDASQGEIHDFIIELIARPARHRQARTPINWAAHDRRLTAPALPRLPSARRMPTHRGRPAARLKAIPRSTTSITHGEGVKANEHLPRRLPGSR